jgi:hypothetical protein
MHRLADRFTEGLEALVGMLSGTNPGALADDPAIKACAEHPVPVISAAMGFTAVRRAAALGVGILFDSLSTPERCRELTDAYRDAGGAGPCIMIRRAWLGEAPRVDFDRQLSAYRGYAARAAQERWGSDELVDSADAESVAAGLLDAVHRAGADALNLRVHVPGVAPDAARAQIEALGDQVVPALRRSMS